MPDYRIAAVYILFLGDEVMYVGQTKHLAQRYLLHKSQSGRRRHRWCFDRMLWIPVARRDLSAFEGAIARALNPKHTVRVRRDSQRDAEILEKLGLKPDESLAFELRAAAHSAAARRRTKRRQKRRARELAAHFAAERVQRFIEAS